MYFLIVSLVAFLTSAAEPAKNCTYSYKPDSVKVGWTGYKFTEKKGVKGEFLNFKVNSPASAATPAELFMQTSVEIDPQLLESGDPTRNINLQKYFFKKLIGNKIVGTIVAFDNAISKVKIDMNGQHKVVPFRMVIDGMKFLAETDIDIIDFKMNKPLESINKTCYDLHKGPDGKSKTWSQVSLALSAELVENCPTK